MFFSPERADTLQQIAILFEFGGFALIVIELYCSDTAKRIEEFFDDFSINNDSIFKRTAKKLREELWSFYSVFMQVIGTKTVATITIGTVFAFFLIFYFSDSYPFRLYVALILIINIFWSVMLIFLLAFIMAISLLHFPIIFIAIFGILLIHPIAWLLRLLNLLASGKALGGLGLVLAALGLSFEFYQVIEMCLSEGCYGFQAQQKPFGSN